MDYDIDYDCHKGAYKLSKDGHERSNYLKDCSFNDLNGKTIAAIFGALIGYILIFVGAATLSSALSTPKVPDCSTARTSLEIMLEQHFHERHAREVLESIDSHEEAK